MHSRRSGALPLTPLPWQGIDPGRWGRKQRLTATGYAGSQGVAAGCIRFAHTLPARSPAVEVGRPPPWCCRGPQGRRVPELQGYLLLCSGRLRALGRPACWGPGLRAKLPGSSRLAAPQVGQVGAGHWRPAASHPYNCCLSRCSCCCWCWPAGHQSHWGKRAGSGVVERRWTGMQAAQHCSRCSQCMSHGCAVVAAAFCLFYEAVMVCRGSGWRGAQRRAVSHTAWPQSEQYR